jgi:putative transposase
MAEIAKEIIGKKVVKPARQRERAHRVKGEYCVNIRIECDVLSISATFFAYQARLTDENAEIGDWLLRLTTANKR